MHLFVTGGTGFLGSHFLAVALADGHHVTALRRLGSRPRIPLDQEPNWCEGNLDDDWSKQLKGCDVLVHLAAAGVSSDKDNWEHCFRVNVTQSLALWCQALDCGVRNFLICGSCFEYGLTGLDYEYIPVDAPLRPTDAYSASKAAATMAALGLANCFDLRVLIARPFHLFGEGEAETRFWPSLVRAAKAGVDFSMSEGGQIRDFMRVEDAAQIILQSINQLETMLTKVLIKNIGTGRPRSLLDFAQEQWTVLDAKGSLLLGRVPYRATETMRYAPLI
jgi:nucleoside-diphosphate-sugar epimerase